MGATLAALKGLVRPLQPDRGVLAASSVEIDLSSVPEGECVTFKFREKPLFIRHRSEDQMANSDSLDISTLRDPQGVKERCRAGPAPLNLEVPEYQFLDENLVKVG